MASGRRFDCEEVVRLILFDCACAQTTVQRLARPGSDETLGGGGFETSFTKEARRNNGKEISKGSGGGGSDRAERG